MHLLLSNLHHPKFHLDSGKKYLQHQEGQGSLKIYGLLLGLLLLLVVLYVAAGVEGVYVLDIGGASPVVLGLARDLGFATALAASGGHTFVLDRGTNALRRFRSDF